MNIPVHFKLKKKKISLGMVLGVKWTELKDSFHNEHFHGQFIPTLLKFNHTIEKKCLVSEKTLLCAIV